MTFQSLSTDKCANPFSIAATVTNLLQKREIMSFQSNLGYQGFRRLGLSRTSCKKPFFPRLFFLTQIFDINISSDHLLAVASPLPPLQVCPKCDNSVGCFRVCVLWDSLLTSNRHGHPLLWSEELETHH